MTYAKLFSQNIGHQFTKNSIRVTAITGAAAMEIGGATTASEFHYMQQRSHATQEEIDACNVDTIGILSVLWISISGTTLLIVQLV